MNPTQKLASTWGLGSVRFLHTDAAFICHKVPREFGYGFPQHLATGELRSYSRRVHRVFTSTNSQASGACESNDAMQADPENASIEPLLAPHVDPKKAHNRERGDSPITGNMARPQQSLSPKTSFPLLTAASARAGEVLDGQRSSDTIVPAAQALGDAVGACTRAACDKPLQLLPEPSTPEKLEKERGK